MTEKHLIAQAKDLTTDFPRSPHERLGGFVIAGRALDKCRSLLAGTNGDYNFDCPLDNFFFGFSKITADALKEIAATGADDEAVSKWLCETSPVSEDAKKLWNMRMRHTRPIDLPMQLQLFLEGYIPEVIPSDRRVYTWFDVYDIEENRI
jgi:hypothetical protein